MHKEQFLTVATNNFEKEVIKILEPMKDNICWFFFLVKPL